MIQEHSSVQQAHDKIYSLLVEKDDITWKSIIYDLIKTKQLDPWDVDVSKLCQHYIERLKELTTVNLHVSGKVLLAATLLLKLQSGKLLGEDLTAFDQLFAASADSDDFYASLASDVAGRTTGGNGETAPELPPRTPQPRSRKVTIQDLVKALEQALEVKHRRLVKQEALQLTLNYPAEPFDINIAVHSLHKRILQELVENGKGKVDFTTLTPNPDRRSKVTTLIPLLHLSNEREIDLHQQEHFGDIAVTMAAHHVKKSTSDTPAGTLMEAHA